MKERGILFRAPMVRALLNGSKTQTRRLVTPRKDKFFGCLLAPHEIAGEVNAGDYTNSIYGEPGDLLWVRESFQALFADGIEDHYQTDYKTGNGYKVYYMATDECQEFVNADDELSDAITPSIFMPRWASRITLEITGVRVQRLQDISAKDIIAEGVVLRPHTDQFGRNPVSAFDGCVYLDLKSLWAAGWEKINGKGSWSANPFVWAISFKRVQ